MASTFLHEGRVLDVAAPRDVPSGAGVLVGELFGVAQVAALNTVSVPIMTEGVHVLPKTSAQAHAAGDQIYWDDTNHRCDNTNVGPLIGVAEAAAANPSATTQVKLRGLAQGVAASVAAIATADGSDAGTTQTLANATKVEVNAILTALKNAKLMA